ncbi:hypothetical protein [Mycolicibacterium mageritense]|uniref:hypothetical protein n=1 Tax=Mycolicibacterium mageritense TaxID=53462 RepID=UPI0011DA018A|nr:hypothetical protein [Mycolicibacterium mageritense]TXI57587.1 MAG: hypothetical protein E6Q55_25860 [Mycolicibacterium mageritense]
MKRTVAAGFLLVLLVEVYAVLVLQDRSVVGWATGVAVAIVLGAMRWMLRDDDDNPGPASDDAAELLAQWMSQTETLVRRADSSRLQWDRHLRPRLAREFAAATGHRQSGDPAAFAATGRMLFGAELWQWVDPNNVIASRAEEPGPGRAVLAEILQRLERL